MLGRGILASTLLHLANMLPYFAHGKLRLPFLIYKIIGVLDNRVKEIYSGLSLFYIKEAGFNCYCDSIGRWDLGRTVTLMSKSSYIKLFFYFRSMHINHKSDFVLLLCSSLFYIVTRMSLMSAITLMLNFLVSKIVGSTFLNRIHRLL